MKKRALFLLGGLLLTALSIRSYAQDCPSSLFTTATSFPAGSHPRSVITGDFNGDGKADLAMANEVSDNVSVLFGDGIGGFGIASNFTAGDGPQSVITADFNGDGKADL